MKKGDHHEEEEVKGSDPTFEEVADRIKLRRNQMLVPKTSRQSKNKNSGEYQNYRAQSSPVNFSMPGAIGK